MNKTALYDKLIAGVTWQELSRDEKRMIQVLQTSDYLYHTRFITNFRYDDNTKALVFNHAPNGDLLYCADNSHQLAAYLLK